MNVRIISGDGTSRELVDVEQILVHKEGVSQPPDLIVSEVPKYLEVTTRINPELDFNIPREDD